MSLWLLVVLGMMDWTTFGPVLVTAGVGLVVWILSRRFLRGKKRAGVGKDAVAGWGDEEVESRGRGKARENVGGESVNREDESGEGRGGVSGGMSGGGRPMSVEEVRERDRQRRGLERDLEILAYEVEQMANRVGAQLDARAIRLERLVEAADQRISELKKLQWQGEIGDMTGQNNVGSKGQEMLRGGQGAAAGGVSGSVGGASGGTGGGISGGGRRLGSVGKVQVVAVPRELGAGDRGGDALAQAVYQMADRGLQPAEIARQVNEHIGKVELILALRRA